MNGCKRVSTLGMSREEWLEKRKGSIGGSDAAAILGISRFATPYTVWADKTGRLPRQRIPRQPGRVGTWRSMWPVGGQKLPAGGWGR